MEESRQILLKLIRTALWGSEGNELSSVPEWDKILVRAGEQTVLGLVAEAVPHLPQVFQPSPQLAMKLRLKALAILQSHVLLNGKIAGLQSRMDADGIPFVLFKGQGVALNYPNPMCRECGDIDIYVGETNVDRARALLNSGSDDVVSVKHVHCEEDNIGIELHMIAETLPSHKRNLLFQQWTLRHLGGNDMPEVEIGGAMVRIPPHQFNAIYIMNHAWHHFMNGGIGFRQLCDWTMFLHKHHADIDKDVLRSDLKMFGLERAWQIFAGIAVRYLGLPSHECPLYNGRYDKKSDMMLDVIWDEGNFGFHSKQRRRSPRPKGHYAGKFHSLCLNARRTSRTFAISPSDITRSWIRYFITGMQNLFVRVR